MLEPEVEARPWAEQLARDDDAYRRQLAYLLDRSAFYRAKLGAAGVDSAEDAGGLDAIARLPLTEKDELRATRTPDNPIGAHLCAAPSELVRIYSTSGTTGAPSYVPLTASDLENWISGSARSYAASGVAAGDRLVSTYNAGPFVAGAALAAFDRIGLVHVPVGTGNTERLLQSIQDSFPGRGGDDAVVRRAPPRAGGGARARPAQVERPARPRRRRAGWRRAGVPP